MMEKRLQVFFSALALVHVLGVMNACSGPNKEAELRQHRPRQQGIFQHNVRAPKLLIGLFVDSQSNAPFPDGTSWATAFPTIQQAIDASVGQDIYVAAGMYKSPQLIIQDRAHIRLVGGYKSGELFEKNRAELKPDEWAILDGEGQNNHLVNIAGDSVDISFAGGFVFQNVQGASAVRMQGSAGSSLKQITIVKSKFINNDNTNTGLLTHGGGVYARFVEDLRLDNLMADGNKAESRGGFLYLVDIDGLSLLGGVWQHNQAAQGGALYLEDIRGLSFSGQIVKANTATMGGGVSLRQIQQQTIKNIQFIDNKGTVLNGANRGAGLHIEACKDLTLQTISLIHNELVTGVDPQSMARIDALGGGIYINQSSTITLDFTNALVSNNKAEKGGALAIDKLGPSSQALTIRHGNFEYNEAAALGGGIFAQEVLDLEVLQSSFSHHVADRGAAIYLVGPGASLGRQTVIDGVLFRDGHARAHAGAVLIEGIPGFLAQSSGVMIKNTQFIGNTSVGNAGALMAKDISYEFSLENTGFMDNKTDNFGGAVALDSRHRGARFFIGADTQFYRNRAARGAGGGAIFAVFNEQNAGALPIVAPAATSRQLVLYTTMQDQSGNSSGPITLGGVVQPGSRGRYGNFMRVTNHAVDDIAPTDLNGGQKIFLQAPRPAIPRLEYFIAYSINPADAAKPWNLLQLNWEAQSYIDVFSW